MPLSLVFLFLVASFLIKHSKWRKYARIIAFALLFLFTNPLIVRYTYLWWEMPALTYSELEKKHEYAVVLTGMLDLDGFPDDRIHFGESVDRIVQGIMLYKKGLVKKILISGGTGSLIHPDLKEAPRLYEFARDFGVPDSVIIVESASRNTYENAKFTKLWLQENDTRVNGVLLVTSSFHMRRSLACFDKQNLEVTAFPVDYSYKEFYWTPNEIIIPSPDALRTWHRLFKEWLGMTAYWLAGYI